MECRVASIAVNETSELHMLEPTLGGIKLFIHESLVEAASETQELKLKELRPHSLHSSTIAEQVKTLKNPELNGPELKPKELRPPSLCSGVILKHDEMMDNVGSTK